MVNPNVDGSLHVEFDGSQGRLSKKDYHNYHIPISKCALGGSLFSFLSLNITLNLVQTVL